MLMAYQSKQHNQLLAQHEREEKDLQEKVSVRRALLEEKVHCLKITWINCSSICVIISRKKKKAISELL